MARTDALGGVSALIGRERECAQIDRLLEDASAGRSGALVVRGEAGIGKSALLDYAIKRADTAIALRATGVEAESDLAFAGLYGLLRPLLGSLDELPERQSAALASGLGMAPAVEADRLLVSAAVLGLLAAGAEERPIVCAIDDAQWLDKPSADALVFAARRLAAERVAMLFGVREDTLRPFDAPGLTELRLQGLDQAAAASLLSTRSAHAAAEVRRRILAEAHGNPLALIELPDALSEDQLSGREPLPEAIPLTPRLQGVFRQRIDRLPRATQMALLLAAADDTSDVAAVVGAASQLGLPGEALDDAETAGLLRTSLGRILFRHPLVRSAVYDGATLSQRCRAHAALAAVLSGDEHADRRIWHRAMATLSTDDDVAGELEASARAARLRSAHASAATAFARAAELSTDAASRTRRLASAAEAAWDAGQGERARSAISSALAAADGDLRARLLSLKGIIEAHAGSVGQAPSLLLDAAGATDDGSVKLELLQEAGEAAAYAGDMETVHRVTELKAGIQPRCERDRFLVQIGSGWVLAFAGEHRAADEAFTDALSLVDSLADPRALVWAADSASAGFGLGQGLAYANRAVELARERGLVSLLPMALHRQASELLWTSRFDLAYAAAQEGYQLALDLGYGTGAHLANMAAVEAVWGRDEEARFHAADALAIGRRSGSNLLADNAEFTLGFIELTAGRPEQASERLQSLVALDRPGMHPVIALHAIPDLVEAAVRAGRAAEISEPLARYRAWVSTATTPSGKALVARCEALVSDVGAEPAFREAIEREAALPPFQRARTELLYGEWLRRMRRRTDARPHLRAAVELFDAVGTHPWRERAEAELRATGETTRKRDPAALDELTPQEVQIAALVAEGLTNREIAARLYLSPRTIDYHLRKVFSKLGISSRKELVRARLPLREQD